jgi:hypothetical protein
MRPGVIHGPSVRPRQAQRWIITPDQPGGGAVEKSATFWPSSSRFSTCHSLVTNNRFGSLSGPGLETWEALPNRRAVAFTHL